MPHIIGKEEVPLEDLDILVVYPVISATINSGIPVLQSRVHRLNM